MGHLWKEAEFARAELDGLRDRIGACEAMGQEQTSRFQVTEVNCKDAVASLKAEQAAEIAGVKAKHEEELPRYEAELQTKVAELRAQRAAEASRLRTVFIEAQRNTERLAQEREEAVEHLSAQQREGSRLQHQCAEAREEVLDLAAQVRSYQDLPRVASQLGVSMDGTMASIEFLPLPGEDPELDIELEAVRRQCRALERECQRTHDAFEKKQAECERWRKRALEERRRHRTDPSSPAEDARIAESEQPAIAPAPFVLGPG